MLDIVVKPLMKAASRLEKLPILDHLSPACDPLTSDIDKQGYLKSQSLAQKCAYEIATLVQPGWTERQAASAMEVWLRDHGVKQFFHRPFAWWGDRARFTGIKKYREFLPTDRRLLENESFILDVAPILNGYISDIGFTGYLGNNEEFVAGHEFLQQLRIEIPMLVQSLNHGGSVWKAVDRKIVDAGYENIHVQYPFGVLGHRVYKTKDSVDVSLLNFGWQSVWEIASRGIFGQLLNNEHEGSMNGLWAIEPQIGGKDWGMKFEEILVVENGQASWLNPNSVWSLKR